MKVSELIDRLVKLKEDNGDLPVWMPESGWGQEKAPVENAVLSMTGDGEPCVDLRDWNFS